LLYKKYRTRDAPQHHNIRHPHFSGKKKNEPTLRSTTVRRASILARHGAFSSNTSRRPRPSRQLARAFAHELSRAVLTSETRLDGASRAPLVRLASVSSAVGCGAIRFVGAVFLPGAGFARSAGNAGDDARKPLPTRQEPCFSHPARPLPSRSCYTTSVGDGLAPTITILWRLSKRSPHWTHPSVAPPLPSGRVAIARIVFVASRARLWAGGAPGTTALVRGLPISRTRLVASKRTPCRTVVECSPYWSALNTACVARNKRCFTIPAPEGVLPCVQGTAPQRCWRNGARGDVSF